MRRESVSFRMASTAEASSPSPGRVSKSDFVATTSTGSWGSDKGRSSSLSGNTQLERWSEGGAAYTPSEGGDVRQPVRFKVPQAGWLIHGIAQYDHMCLQA